MLDWRRETLLKPKDVAARLGVTLGQVYAWASVGLRAPDGRRVRLEMLKVGTLRTSEEALQRFFEAASPRHEELPRSRAERVKADRDAAAWCDANGW